MVGSTFPHSISLAADSRNPSMHPRAQHHAPQHPRTIRGVYTRADLMTSPHMPLAAVNSTTSNRLSSGTAATPTPTPSTRFAARPSSVPVVTIVGGAVGGVVALAVVLALIYVLRVRRRVRSLQKCTDILGPELTPMPRPPDRANTGVTITLDSHVKVDDSAHIVSPLSPVHHGRLRSSSTTSITEQAFSPLSTTRRSTFTAGISPVSPLTPHQHRRSLNSSSPSISSPISSLSPTRRHTSTIVIGNPPAVSLQPSEQHGRSLALSTPLVTSLTEQAGSPSSPTRRRRPAISVDIPSAAPPLTLHQYGRRSSPLGTSPIEHASSPQSPTHRRRRRKTISVDTPPAVPPRTPDQHGRFLLPGTRLAGDVTASPTDSNSLSSIPGSTTTIDPPPPAAWRTSIRHSSSRVLIRSPNSTRPWHFPTSHPRHQPQYDWERSARSDSSPEAW